MSALSNAVMEPGVTLFNPRRRVPPARMSADQARRFNQGFGLLVAVDEAGHVIWYYRSDSRISDFEHGPTITPDGHLLLFDNGNFQARPFDQPVPPVQTRSRVVEYVLDEDTRSLRERWSSVSPQDPPVVSFAMGSTQYLPQTGNLLAGYGFLVWQDEVRDRTWQTLGQSRVWTRVREYTHEAAPEVVWELTLRARDNDFGLGWSLFGARRIGSFPPRVKQVAHQPREQTRGRIAEHRARR